MEKSFSVLIVLLVNVCLSIEWIRKNGSFQYQYPWNTDLLIDDGPSNIIIKTYDKLKGLNFNCSVKNFIDITKLTMQVIFSDGFGEKMNSSDNISFSKNIDTSNQNMAILQVTVNASKDGSSRLWCQATDLITNMTIETNFLEIRDISYWKMNYVKTNVKMKFQNITSIDTKNMPLVYTCPLEFNKAPTWVNNEIVNIQWFACETPHGEKPKSCSFEQANKLINKQYLKYLKIENDLVITGFNEDRYKGLPIFFVCMFSNHMISAYGSKIDGVYIEGVKITDGATDQDFNILKNSKSYVINEILPYKVSKNSNKHVRFTPVVSGKKYYIAFYFKGKQLIDSIKHKLTDKYLEFNDTIDFKDAGIYTAEVIDLNSTNILNTTFELIVKGPPKIVSKLPEKTKYIPENSMIEIPFKFMKDTVKRLIVYLDSVVVYDSKDDVEKYKNKTQSNKFYEMNYTVCVSKDLNEVIYKVENIQSKYDHVVKIIAQNDLGKALIQFSIFVIPPLNFLMGSIGKHIKQQSPNNYDCVSKCKSEPHQFMCNIDTAQYHRKNIQTEITWMFQVGKVKKEITNYTYFNVSSDKKSIVLNPTMDEDLENSSKYGYLICILTLKMNKLNNNTSSDCQNNRVMCAKIVLEDQSTVTEELNESTEFEKLIEDNVTNIDKPTELKKKFKEKRSALVWIVVIITIIILVLLIIMLIICCFGKGLYMLVIKLSQVVKRADKKSDTKNGKDID